MSLDRGTLESQRIDSQAAPAGAVPFELPELASASRHTDGRGAARVAGVELNVTIEMGRKQIRLDELQALRVGSVVPLDSRSGEPVDVLVENRLAARGELSVLNGRFCVRIVERIASLEPEISTRAW